MCTRLFFLPPSLVGNPKRELGTRLTKHELIHKVVMGLIGSSDYYIIDLCMSKGWIPQNYSSQTGDPIVQGM